MIRFGWFDNVKPWINPFTPGSDQFQISPTASPEILHHTLWRTWLFPGYSERSLYTTNSHYLTHTFLLKGWENVLFEIGRERLNEVISWQCASISFDFRHFCSGAWPESGVGSRQRNFWLCRRNQVQYRQLATVRKCHGRIGRREHFEGPWRVDGLGALQGLKPSDRWGQQCPAPRLSSEGCCAVAWAKLSITWERWGGGGGVKREMTKGAGRVGWTPSTNGAQIWGTRPAPPLQVWLTMLLPLITNRVSTHSHNRRSAAWLQNPALFTGAVHHGRSRWSGEGDWGTMRHENQKGGGDRPGVLFWFTSQVSSILLKTENNVGFRGDYLLGSIVHEVEEVIYHVWTQAHFWPVNLSCCRSDLEGAWLATKR